MKFKFSKWQGAGNDFVIVNGFEEKIDDYKQTAREICDRHFGVGADGLVLILPSDTADFQMRIFNSDGSEAEMCGNVTRCVARYVYETGLTASKKITLETKAGLIKPELILAEDGMIRTVRVDMGEPRLCRGQIPMTGNPAEQPINIPLQIADTAYSITCVSMGNPHCVIFVNDAAAIDLKATGSMIETNLLFPKKTNVEFVQVLAEDKIRMRVWERGAGITMACGTGACAAAVAAILNNKINRTTVVELDGGQLVIEWAEDNHVYMSGPAEEVFRGVYI
ncbi:MAG: diaminopimelate epimerase [Veillonellales bacterium]